MLQVATSMNESNAMIGQWQVVLQINTNKMAAAHMLQRKRAVAVLFLTLFAEEEENRTKKRNRKQYVREWIARREERGIYHQLVKELEVQSCCVPRDFFRLTKGQFLFLVERLRPLIGEKKEQPLPLNSVRSTVKPDELNWRENFSSQSQRFFSRFVAWQVAAVVVVRATNPKFVAKSRSQVYFAQHVAACNIEILLSDKLFK